ncbi:MAG: FAD-binding protein [Cyclobacteriaceae bacterium]|nr:FAD-binding protein [Cyclobacteriaceae bacterium]
MYFNKLAEQLKGELLTEQRILKIYATDASAYRELPLAVAIPADTADIITLVNFARENNCSLIPRTAGTSLAGQVVGKGIVVDVSRKFNQILEVNTEEQWVRLQPGVIRNELNMHLAEQGFLFGPETATANRAMIGGMIGNNSCGSNSIVYGSTRENLLEVKAILSDGEEVIFSSLDNESFFEKSSGKTTISDREKDIYATTYALLSNAQNRQDIDKEYPKRSIPRRNTGYAIDLLKDTNPFGDYKKDFNFCQLIAGSEGTLAFITEAKLKIVPLPPPFTGLICIHFNSIYESLLGNLVALEYKPSASELIDHYILECTKDNITQSKNRFFVEGDPQAILVVELKRQTLEEVENDAAVLIQSLKDKQLGYHYPLVTGSDTTRVWELRNAGLGLLSNMPGDAKPAPVIEDTAVDVQDLPNYIKEFNLILEKHGLFSVHYAHAGSGELHLRPIINLKTKEGNRMFRTIAEEIATLVKRYGGSLSGEHGDGRLRGEFIPQMIGEQNYEILKAIKKAWDPQNIFNPGKIVDSPAMNEMLRFTPGQETPDFDTALRFDKTDGFMRAVEQCNGAGVCRKTELTGGTMCPSYMASHDEKDTTRARANILREALSRPDNSLAPFANEDAYSILDLCLSCKGCTSECPSNVDMARIKAEFLHQYYKTNRPSLRTKLIANFSRAYQLGTVAPGLFNLALTFKPLAALTKSVLGIAPQRSLPALNKQTLRSWYNRKFTPQGKKTVYFFCDEFTNLNDSDVGIKAINLLDRLGFEVKMVEHAESGRTYISKGFLDKAKVSANENVRIFSPLISADTPLVGLEPSAILGFRDEYPDLVDTTLRTKALELGKNCLTIEEFLDRESDNIDKRLFTDTPRQIKLHGHCHQKSLSSLTPTKKILMVPPNYKVQLIPSGCCGMAGSFGYEKEHYETSQKVGELVLFPAVRETPEDVIIAAPGTSCRHQIKDGTGRKALHPVEILWEALKEK